MGKGDGRRPADVPAQAWESEYERIFGVKKRQGTPPPPPPEQETK